MRRVGPILVLATVMSACAAPAPSPSASPSATLAPPTAEPSGAAPSLALQSAQASARPSIAASPPMGPRPPFEAGSLLVTVSDDVRVRSKPRVSSDSIKYEPLLATGTNLSVLAGPVAASGFWWYRVRLEDGLTLSRGITTGWVAAADHDGEPWIAEAGDYLEEPDLDVPPDVPDLPVPVLDAVGTEDDVGGDGKPYTYYLLSVYNWADYPAELFAPTPDLEPCGLNASASRTWVDIIDTASLQSINAFCALAEPQDLTGIWFALPQGTAPPSLVHVVLWDRLTSNIVESNSVSPSSPLPASPTPAG